MLSQEKSVTPKQIHLRLVSNLLEIHYENLDNSYKLQAEYLRTHAPLPDTKHEKVEQKLIYGKQNVKLLKIEAVGYYAVKLSFDDNYSALFGWEYLQKLCVNQDENWGRYLQNLKQQKLSRDPNIQILKLD